MTAAINVTLCALITNLRPEFFPLDSLRPTHDFYFRPPYVENCHDFVNRDATIAVRNRQLIVNRRVPLRRPVHIHANITYENGRRFGWESVREGCDHLSADPDHYLSWNLISDTLHPGEDVSCPRPAGIRRGRLSLTSRRPDYRLKSKVEVYVNCVKRSCFILHFGAYSKHHG